MKPLLTAIALTMIVTNCEAQQATTLMYNPNTKEYALKFKDANTYVCQDAIVNRPYIFFNDKNDEKEYNETPVFTYCELGQEWIFPSYDSVMKVKIKIDRFFDLLDKEDSLEKLKHKYIPFK